MGRFTKFLGVVGCALALFFLSTDILRAQNAAPASGGEAASDDSNGKAGRRGRGGRFDEEMLRRFLERRGRRGQSGARPGQTNPDPKKAKSDEKKKDKPDDKAKAAEETPVVKRPTEPTAAPDPNELKQKPDADGKVQLKFRGQPWEGVLNWLADVSDLTLDWVEIPAGYLNLTTKGRYTAEEARDMLNARLLSRGFTILHHDEGLTVVNIKKNLDPSMVPRVRPDELAERSDYEFVKTSFQLNWLVAENMAKELESMKSKNGTLVAMTTTNRLEAMDSVKNLREIYRLLSDEQSDTGEESLLRMFHLKNSRASDVVELLQEFLGIESKAKGAPMTPQQRPQSSRRQQAQQGNKPATAKKDKPEIHIIAVPRENSILATAPPDKMAIIEKAIQAIDSPPRRSEAREFDARNIISYKVYRLSAINPEMLIKTLDDAGDLHFNTRLEADVENNAIIARATRIDHATIGELVARLDSSARKFYVIRLKHLAADYVAGSIEKMMGVEQEQQSRGGFSFFGRRSRSGRSGRQEEPKDKFSVDADVEFNRLILKANKAEYDAVAGLLVALGEMPREGGNPDKIRFIEGGPDAATLERIIGVMESMVPNKIQNNVPKERKKKPAEAESEEKPRQRTTKTRISAGIAPAGARSVSALANHGADRAAKPSLTLVQVSQQQDAGDKEESQEAAPPDARKQPPTAEQFDDERLRRILERSRRRQQQTEPKPSAKMVISRTPDGRLVITSDDPKVLDLFERLLGEMAPPSKEFVWIRLKYAHASVVAYDLEDFFKEEDDQPQPRRYSFYGTAGNQDKGLGRLSKRRPLKFIYDVRTNSVLVQGADADQLRTIKDLIEYYDQPTPVDSESARQIVVYKVSYSKAEVVAEAVKEVFRDLLSANDKSLQKNQKEKPQTERSYTYNYGSPDGKEQQKVPNFKGALSIGVDNLSNTLIVSAPEYVMKHVAVMIEQLDEAARPTSTVDVLSVGGGVNAQVVQQALSKILGQPAVDGKKDAKSDTKEPRQNQQPNQGNRGQNNGRGRRSSYGG